MMPDHFIDDKPQEFLGKFRIEIGVAGQLSQARYLFFFAGGICGRQVVCGLILTNRLGHLEAFGEHEHQGRVDIIDALPVLVELVVHILGRLILKVCEFCKAQLISD